MGRKAGLSDEKLLALSGKTLSAETLSGETLSGEALSGEDLSVFNRTERLVIELADAMADTPSNVSDELYARLRDQFSEEQLLELGGQIAFENFRARLNRIFDVESDQLYTPSTKSHEKEDTKRHE